MITLLVNPISGGGKAEKALSDIEAFLKQENKDYVIRKTHKPGEATDIAKNAVKSGHEAIIVAGGDGTMSEVLSGISASGVSVIFAPCGTGNDFVKCMDIPADPLKAVIKQFSSPLRRLDYATVNGRAFLNVCGAGFDVEVLRRLEKYRTRMSGMKAYLFALKDALKYYKPIECMISVDDGPYEKKSLCIFAMANGKYFGGGMKVSPDAVPYDGYLNLVMVNSVKKWMIPFLLPLFIGGHHTKLKICTTLKCKHVRVRMDNMTMQLDGELHEINNADIAIVPSGVGARY
ncbi:MAG: diacylglycerol kinase family lipid kinase [Clostridia bacterium]|nr:diacylglycerol kinase family lipid kinase [Clostridia bacterium]MBQ2433457.1 diacylglycerol kinase family lipid kinase [Clostridia bacterium]